MSVTQYIGARYVPVFADPIEWSSEKQYEPLTIVLHEGNSFTSKQFVPIGIAITNTDFWGETGNYNAQIETYRNEVLELAEDVSEVVELVPTIASIIPSNEFTPESTVKDYIDITKFVQVFPDMTQAEINEILENNRFVFFNYGTYSVEISDENPAFGSFGYGYVVPSNTTVLFNDCIIRVQPTAIDGYGVFMLSEISNVSLFGKCKIVGDLDAHLTSSSLHSGHGINIWSCTNVSISGFYISKCWGDGIAIRGLGGGLSTDMPYSQDVEIYDVICDDNGRNGFSIISGVNVYVHDCQSHNHTTASPYCGVDIEPNATTDRLTNIRISSMTCLGNGKHAVKLFLDSENSLENSINIEVDNVYSNNPLGAYVPESNTATGYIVFRNCTIQKRNEAINVEAAGSLQIAFSDITIHISGSQSSLPQYSLIYITGTRLRRCKFHNIKTMGNGTVYSIVHWTAVEDATSTLSSDQYMYFDICAPNCSEAHNSNILYSEYYSPSYSANAYSGAPSTNVCDGFHTNCRMTLNTIMGRGFLGTVFHLYITGDTDRILTAPDGVNFVQNGVSSTTITIPAKTLVTIIVFNTETYVVS